MTTATTTPPTLSIDVDWTEGIVVFQLEGQLNWSTARELTDRIGSGWAEPCAIIDLSRVTAMDAAGTGAILNLANVADAKCKQLVFVADQSVAEVLRYVGLPEVAPIFRSTDDALRDIRTTASSPKREDDTESAQQPPRG